MEPTGYQADKGSVVPRHQGGYQVDKAGLIPRCEIRLNLESTGYQANKADLSSYQVGKTSWVAKQRDTKSTRHARYRVAKSPKN
ncbi:unnamed protein product [Linum trigynum]|uniref:Uncharacterized protein n=1 Tax=Linum trigynum TaxID=586398 RepID=A0AAV2CYV7_9ROSI